MVGLSNFSATQLKHLKRYHSIALPHAHLMTDYIILGYDEIIQSS